MQRNRVLTHDRSVGQFLCFLPSFLGGGNLIFSRTGLCFAVNYRPGGGKLLCGRGGGQMYITVVLFYYSRNERQYVLPPSE